MSKREVAGSQGYTLVICEKPDAARRVAEALSSGTPRVFKMGGTSVFQFEDARGKRYVVCAAMGHLYGISDTVKDRRVYPVADLEWFPLGAISDKASSLVESRIRAIRSLSDKADAFVNACDLDIEGDTIGYNILRYACQGKEDSALRARFSSLVKEEIVEAFGDSRLRAADNLARAGRLRHAVDFLWGINLSRALSESLRTGHGYRVVSIGRVQGPTLNFVVGREAEVRAFVPTPYWTGEGRLRKGDSVFEARYSVPVLRTKQAAYEVKSACEGREGVVTRVAKRGFTRRPPPPLNLADLQKEAFRLFGYAPSRTLQIAERLYLGALISYPRTGSQRLPKVDYAEIISKIVAMPGYAGAVGDILSRGHHLHPTEGQNTDQAHPAIYPTGESVRRSLGAEEAKVFDLVVRRFLSCFGEDAVYEGSYIAIAVGEQHEFAMDETRVVTPGWLRFAAGGSRQADHGSMVSPDLREGDLVEVEEVAVAEHLRARPVRYSQATLLEKMEKEGIGTNATRAGIISTLLDRHYVAGDSLVPTELGFALIEAMRRHCPQIISTSLTRDIEAHLERIEGSPDSSWEFYEETLSSLLRQLGQVRSHEDEIGSKMRVSVSEGRVILGRCLVCKKGELWVVRSRKSGKRFVGCTNYSGGCTASAPLPQRGGIKVASKPCSSCGWPVVYVGVGRRRWKLCVNDRCPRKVNVYKMQKTQRRPTT